jgi:hypothetical protein
MTLEISGNTRQTAHHHIPKRLNLQPHICKILTPHILLNYAKNSKAKCEILVPLAVSRDVCTASCDKRNVSSTDTNCNHSEPPTARSALCGSLPPPFCACPADLASAIISSTYSPPHAVTSRNECAALFA